MSSHYPPNNSQAFNPNNKNNKSSQEPEGYDMCTDHFCAIDPPSSLENWANGNSTNMDEHEHTAAQLYERAMNGQGPYDAESHTSFPESAVASVSPSANDTTVVVSNSTTGAATQMQRERTYTDDTTSSSGSISKHTLVKLMKEQVDLVRRLTNAQIEQKRELERIKEEKRQLEESQRQQAAVAAAAAAAAAPPPPVAAPVPIPTPPISSRLNLPTRGLAQHQDGNQSISSRFLPHRSPSVKQYPRRHPDSRYYNNRSPMEENTINNANPSMASTIMPSAIIIDTNKARGTGAFGDDHNQPAVTGPGAFVNGLTNKDSIEITYIPERNVVTEQENTCVTSMWWAFSRLCTLFIPDMLMCWVGNIKITKGMNAEAKREAKEASKEAKQAWREKVAIFIVMLSFSAGFIAVSGVIPAVLCGEEDAFLDETKTKDVVCGAFSYVMYSVMIIIAAVLAIQCLCSLIYLVRMKRTITRDDTRSKIIVMVPCYNEGDKELRKTIDSVMDTSYPDDNKVLLVVADGNITGKGERFSTPEVLSKILGYKMNPSDKMYKCKSIGELTENRAKLHYGICKDAGKELKYIVLVKCGTLSEQGSSRAGNRGKRDSQLLFSGLLNRFHHGRKLNELDKAIKNALDHLQLPLEQVRYLMAIDADTRVDRESISHMTYSMNKNDQILALCGETKVDNKSESWVTMIQVFEYYTNHHLKKAFESIFGCVTCLPGCFTMYRLFSDDGRPLLSCDDVYQRYATNNVKSLHEKNLYHLGEDRMLTTLLLRYFPDMKLSFVPEASCYTIVPHTFSVLLSQRRRWINSTFHNMLELLRVNTMCGFCCFSMKSIVLLDLIATLILPASLIYVGYIVYITVWMDEPLSLLMMVVWGIVIGVQVVVFLLRSRWDYWWWFIVFVLAGVPVFYFILPLYSFWHMDDFSWGTTRQVSGAAPTKPITTVESGDTLAGRESPDDDFEEQRIAQSHRVARQAAKRPPAREEVGRLNLKPKLHSTVVDCDEDYSAGDTSRTTYDPNKYRDAEEAKNARRLRRGEC